MNAMEFIADYPEMVNSIRKIAKPKYLPAIEALEATDPHDLVTPKSVFYSSNHALGNVFALFLDNVENLGL